jgi:hypothetical protein
LDCAIFSPAHGFRSIAARLLRWQRAFAEQPHERRHEQRAHDGGVDQDAGGHSDGDLLHEEDRAHGEGEEHDRDRCNWWAPTPLRRLQRRYGLKDGAADAA